MRFRDSCLARYAIALIAIAAAFVLRQALVRLVGAELPPWISFYPTVMFVALSAGLGPGLLATASAALLAAWFYFPPAGFAIGSLSNIVSVALFLGMGLFMSTVAWLYLNTKTKLWDLVAERTGELSRTNDELRREVEERRRAEEELRAGIEELHRFNRAAVDRELRMIQLKREVNEMCAATGRPMRYPLDIGNEVCGDRQQERESI